jgi:FecR protein
MGAPRKLAFLVFCASGMLVLPLAAQKVVSAKAGLITYLQGPAFVDGQRVVLRATRFPQMRNGETLSTSRGRAELLLSPGAVLRLSENSQVRMEDTQLADTRVTLQRGDALIEVVQLPDGNRIQVALADTTTELTRTGLYRFGIVQNDTARGTLRVYGGEALVHSGLRTASVKRGMTVNLDTGLNPGLTVTKFDRKQTDMLHAWSARRSFDLFMSDPEARQKQNHWQSAGGGYLENKNFGVEFRAFIRRRTPSGIRPAIPRAENR